VIVLVSGVGSNLQALIDAAQDPVYGASIVAVGADRPDIEALARAEQAGIPTFVIELSDFDSRADWDIALTEHAAKFDPDLVVLAGFMKLLGSTFLDRFGGRTVNTHPSLLPSFPGAHGPRDALKHGVKITGATLFLVDEGLDEGPILAQVPVPVEPGDDVESLHERIKVAEREMLTTWVDRLAREGVGK